MRRFDRRAPPFIAAGGAIYEVPARPSFPVREYRVLESLMPELIALGSVIAIDIVLAGDNALVVGMAAANVEAVHRRRVIVLGIGAAIVLRIAFALTAVELMEVLGLLLVGGLLLLWVAWKLWLEARQFGGAEAKGVEALEGTDGAAILASAPAKSPAAAFWQIAVADVSMSIDNVLGVAGAARDHPWVMATGLVLSVALMGACASFFAGLFVRLPWLAYGGVAVIAVVAMGMIYEGGGEVAVALAGM